MTPQGRTPSLIGGGAGKSTFVIAAGKRTCKRCRKAIAAGSECVEVAKPGTMGHKTYCRECFAKVLEQTEHDLESLRKGLSGPA